VLLDVIDTLVDHAELPFVGDRLDHDALDRLPA
jgi:hypothetical protein